MSQGLFADSSPEQLNLLASGLVAVITILLVLLIYLEVRLKHSRQLASTLGSDLVNLLQSASHGVLLCTGQRLLMTNHQAQSLLKWEKKARPVLSDLADLLPIGEYRQLLEHIEHQQGFSCHLHTLKNGPPLLLQGQPYLHPGWQEACYLIRLFSVSEQVGNPNFERLCQHLNEIQDAALVVDQELKICAANAQFSKLSGFQPAQAVGRNLASLRSEDNPPEFYQQLWQQVEASGHWSGKLWSRDAEGRKYLHRLTVSEILNEQGKVTHYLGIYSDLPPQEQRELQPGDALYLAAEQKRLEQRFQERVSSGEAFNFLLLNINRFSRIQNTCGMAAAQEVLVQLQQRLLQVCSSQDDLIRYGKDEFIILCPASEYYTQSLLGELIRVIQDPMQLDGMSLFVSVTFGLAGYPQHADSLSELLAAAGIAMRTVGQGENQVGVFNKGLRQQAEKNLRLESLLRDALGKNQLQLHYQPVFNRRCEIVKVEALLRWDSPELGSVSPAEFIPVAEQSSLIDKLGHWVIHEACRQHKAWQKQGYVIPLAINISSRQLRDGRLAQKLQRAINLHGVDSSQLQLEITESALMEQMETGTDILNTLQQQGFSIAIDDFGTGYSSLAYLQKLPASTLKIDRTFVSSIGSQQDTRVLDSIIQMGKNLQLSLVVEGVETAAQLLYLQSRQCDYYQGFLLAKPMPSEQLVAQLEAKSFCLAQVDKHRPRSDFGQLQLVSS